MPEEKEFMTFEEAAEYLGVGRSTLYSYVQELHIETHKFFRDKRKYLALADVRRIKQVRETPWLADREKENEAA